MAKKVIGFCHVCGIYDRLSEEHVPPKRAFNDKPYVELSFDRAVSLGPEDVPDKGDGRIRQGGIRFPTLCNQCNNDFGSWYAKAFVEWCYRGMFVLDATGGSPAAFCATDVYPLRIVKQIVAMFFSVNSNQFRLSETGQDLVWLLKNKEAKGLPDGVRVFTYFNWQGQPRHNGIAALFSFTTGRVAALSEITYPPFGYVMTLNTEPNDPRLFEVTDWAWCDYDDERTVCLKLPVLPTHLTWLSGDYRDLDQIKADAVANIEEARRQGIPPAAI